VWKTAPSIEQGLWFWASARERPKLGDWSSGFGDGHPLTVLHAVDHLAAMIAKVAY